MAKKLLSLILIMVIVTALAGCGGSKPGMGNGGYEAPEMQISSFHEDQAEVQGDCKIDISEVSKGTVAASAISDKGLKFQVCIGEAKYNYDLKNDGTPECFILQGGDGTYTFRILENTTEDRYAELFSVTCDVTLESEGIPFLRPSQTVNYDKNSGCVAKASEISASADSDTDVVALIYDYIVNEIEYDTEKAQSVPSGYVANPDETLASGKGICIDYAVLAAAMLRSQGIPTKVITGYVAPDNIYHAWNMVYTESEGWITVEIAVAGENWDRIDITFAASGADSDFIGDGSNYIDYLCY